MRVVFLEENLAPAIKSSSKHTFDNSIAKYRPKNILSHTHTDVFITAKKNEDDI